MFPNNSKKSLFLDITKIIIKLVIEEGKLVSEVLRTLNIPSTTIRSFWKKYETSNSIEANQRGGRRQFVADNCTTTIQGIIGTLELDVCHTTVWRWLKENNYSRKTTRPIPEKRNDPEIIAERMEYALWYQSILPHIRYSHIVYVDESPFNLHGRNNS
ncbi:hypothetical protein RF11_07781 [Thelohanellus kitauei]|uniref:Transposase Tc1-like domain-containing protein n=1 Tax=Thelohanellus kitauei TaxID=669202 RepID=A0A0C2IS18_THEKT|nr:hypothetical protein RF11_07781 [Thelohanellus kitauei]